jgi:acyl-coenzyme A synthetase/AMP-(fatty) acid ligase
MKNTFSIAKGDHVLLYMPNIPQTAMVMLTCARIGAIHTLTHGGCNAKNLADRLDECDPKMIITTTAGYHNDKPEVICFPAIIDEAIGMTSKLSNKAIKKLTYNRPEVKC